MKVKKKISFKKYSVFSKLYSCTTKVPSKVPTPCTTSIKQHNQVKYVSKLLPIFKTFKDEFKAISTSTPSKIKKIQKRTSRSIQISKLSYSKIYETLLWAFIPPLSLTLKISKNTYDTSPLNTYIFSYIRFNRLATRMRFKRNFTPTFSSSSRKKKKKKTQIS